MKQGSCLSVSRTVRVNMEDGVVGVGESGGATYGARGDLAD